MADDSDPPRKFYQLKPKEFTRLNEPPRPAAETDTGRTGRIDVRDLARQASAGTPPLGANASVNRTNDVQAMLQDNLHRANEAGLNNLAPKEKRRSRRNRDYWLLFVPVNAFFGFWAFGPWANPMSFVYGLAGIVLFTTGLTWVMFFVMDDY